jgi:hypothetical protein
MKKSIGLLFIVLLALAGSSCNDEVPDKGKLDSNAMICLRPAPGTTIRFGKSPALRSARLSNGHLSALEIVKQADGVWFWNEPIYGHQAVSRGFDNLQRDTLSPALKMWGTDIISQYGLYVPDFIEGVDCILDRILYVDPVTKDTASLNYYADEPYAILSEVRTWMDTIAYIPNSVLRNAELQVKAAYANGDYTTVYKIFNEAFTFTPITGAEWRALKEQGLN